MRSGVAKPKAERARIRVPALLIGFFGALALIMGVTEAGVYASLGSPTLEVVTGYATAVIYWPYVVAFGLSSGDDPSEIVMTSAMIIMVTFWTLVLSAPIWLYRRRQATAQ